MKTIGSYRMTALLAGVMTLGLVGAAGSVALAGAQPQAKATAAEPKIVRLLPQDLTPMLYFPLVLRPLSTPINLANGSFEADTAINFQDNPNAPCQYQGFTDQPKGNQ